MNPTSTPLGGRTALGALLLALTLSSTSAGAATTDPAAAPQAVTRADAHVAEQGSTEGAAGPAHPVRIGALAGVALPRPVSVEGMIEVSDVVAFGLEYSVLPPVTISGVRATLDAIDVDLRVFPARGAFFFGVNGGHQRFDASGTAVLPMGLGMLPEHLTADSWYIEPRLGFLWTWRSGVSLGVDAGAQIPVSASFTSTLSPQLPGYAMATDVTRYVGKGVMPNVNLLRFGYLF